MIYKVTESHVRKVTPWEKENGETGKKTYQLERTTHWLLGIPVFTSDVIIGTSFKEDRYKS